MKHSHSFHPSLAAFRPWPFGPPLRGRAPRGEAGVTAAHGQANPAGLPPASGPCSGAQATVPVGDLAWRHPIYSA
jgi:hypothetical protein